jgi:hypothetical protein
MVPINCPDIVEVTRRQRDPFKEVVERLMATIETVLKESMFMNFKRVQMLLICMTNMSVTCWHYFGMFCVEWVEAELPSLAAKLVAPVSRGTDQYTIWIGQLFRVIHEVYDQRLRQLYVSCHEFLDVRLTRVASTCCSVIVMIYSIDSSSRCNADAL